MQVIRQTAMELLLELAVFAAVVAQVALLYERVFLLTAMLLVTASLVLTVRPDGVVNVSLFVAGAVLGPAGEMFCAAAGAWTYSHETFLGIPLWLPLAWGLAVVVAKEIAATLTRGFVPQA
jgi:hypothetical protein